MKNDKFVAQNRCVRCGAFTPRDAGSVCARCGKLTHGYAGEHLGETRNLPTWWVAVVVVLPLLFWLFLAAACFSSWLRL